MKKDKTGAAKTEISSFFKLYSDLVSALPTMHRNLWLVTGSGLLVQGQSLKPR